MLTFTGRTTHDAGKPFLGTCSRADATAHMHLETQMSCLLVTFRRASELTRAKFAHISPARSRESLQGAQYLGPQLFKGRTLHLLLLNTPSVQ
ncbi:hypothetical protein SERLA73DRAFT_191021 [Serpula lacrymans var. lacrymans S7.3]|uniref:Uncharacterized protein n=2 Tax=Serpula lacrymans var. lacrymans TaxID=341189 RepID=F8QGT6_SERL3|nr:uncharacterized protein SERLADRAFT_457166 [Serpula lacrymans var. lacrymans S7.9]EGN92519.1 hypothetical protein SERLA73DRAFT_191021 [Serpula lacrymans var. lacrymans S7.3]EGO29434.1 hypothetical protein SERLADRAFT_457166 [Serpula lacrymans var. lacrymans S7.9]